MKKFKLLIILLLLVLQGSFAQNPYTIIEFDSTIGSVRDVLKLSENELIIVGNKKYISGQPSKIFIAKINTDGEIIWKKEHIGGIPFLTDGNSLCRKSNGNFYIAMGNLSSSLLLETNPSGDSIWSYCTGDTLDYPTHFGTIKEFQGNGNGFVLTELHHDPDPMFGINATYYYILDSNGVVNFKFEAENDITYDVQIISEGEFLSTERCYNDYKSEIIKYNIDGQMLLYDTCLNNPYSEYNLWELSTLKENYFYGSGNVSYPLEDGLLSKIDLNGHIEFCVSDTSIDELLGTVETVDKQIIYYGIKSYYYSSKDSLVIGHYNTGNEFIPKIKISYIPEGSIITTDLIVADENLFIFTHLFNIYNPVMIKIPVDSIVSSIDNGIFNVLKTYPNPANEYFVFQVSDAMFPIGLNSNLIITDVFGHEVGQFALIDKQIIIDCRGFSSGIYFYRIKFREKNYSGKFLIIR